MLGGPRIRRAVAPCGGSQASAQEFKHGEAGGGDVQGRTAWGGRRRVPAACTSLLDKQMSCKYGFDILVL